MENDTCVNYCALNKVTISNQFPILIVNKILKKFHDTNIFSRLNFCLGYHPILIHHDNILKMTFCTHEGH